MATRTINLPISAALPASGATSNAAPELVTVESSGASPKVRFWEARFDSATNEHLWWAFELPSNYVGTPKVRLNWKANVTSGDVRWAAVVAAITPGDADTPNEKAPAAENAQATTVNATEARRLVATEITLTNADSMAAGDWVALCVYRDASDAGDTVNANDAELVSVAFTYADA